MIPTLVLWFGENIFFFNFLIYFSPRSILKFQPRLFYKIYSYKKERVYVYSLPYTDSPLTKMQNKNLSSLFTTTKEPIFCRLVYKWLTGDFSLELLLFVSFFGIIIISRKIDIF